MLAKPVRSPQRLLTAGAMTDRLRQPLWIVPLAIAGLVALFGWWGNSRLRQTIVAQLKAELFTTLDANVTALEIWTTNQAKLATALAEEPRVRSLANRILERFDQAEGDSRKLSDVSEIGELRNYLRPRLKTVGYEIAQLVSTNFLVVASSMGGGFRQANPVYDEHLAKFSELFASGQPIIITPFKPRRPAPGGPRMGGRRGRDGESPRPFDGPISPRGKGTNVFSRGLRGSPPDLERFRRGDFTLMQVAAPVRDNGGAVRGALALIINPDAEFTRILSVARSGIVRAQVPLSTFT